jgi:restriction system protein
MQMSVQTDSLSKVPRFYDLMFPCLKALKALGGSGNNEEILDKVCELERYPQEVQQAQHTDHQQTALNYRLAWAKTYLKRVGALANSQRGVWTVTEKGGLLTKEDAEKIRFEVRKLVAAGRNKKGGDKAVAAEGDGEDGAERLDWRDRLISMLVELKPDAFERLAQRILREAGFIKVQVTGKSGDGGIDGVGILRVNLVSFTVLFQCKRYQGSVGPSTIRDFRGAMQGRCDKGIVITTGTFSSDSRKEATRDGAPAIDLIDGEALCDLLKSLKLGVAVELVEEIHIDADWFSQL